MPIIQTTREIIITSGGGTINLDIADSIQLYLIKGTTTLTSNLTIQPIDTLNILSIGTIYKFKYKADITLDGNTITIFGETLPPHLADKKMQITAYYNGSTWEVNFIPDFSQNSIMTFNNIDGGTNLLQEEIIAVPISFETGYLGNNFVYLRYEGTGTLEIHNVSIGIAKAIEGTDDAQFIIKYGNTSTNLEAAGGQTIFEVTAGTPKSLMTNPINFTNNHILNLNNSNFFLDIQTSKTTPGGEIVLYFLLKKY